MQLTGIDITIVFVRTVTNTTINVESRFIPQMALRQEETMATKNEKRVKKQKLTEARKEYTRAKALRELNEGADFNDDKYTKHRNYHVRMRAWNLAGSMIPDNEAERKELCDSLTKGRTGAGVVSMQLRFGLLAEPNPNNKVEAA